MIITVEPIDADAFKPFGDLLAAPAAPGRRAFGDGLANLRADAKLDLTLSMVTPQTVFPLAVHEFERHPFSSQSFLPLLASRWLAIVAPSGAHGGPDARGARAFLVGPHEGVTYHFDVWHSKLTALDDFAQFAVLTWRNGGVGDEEFHPLAQPITVVVSEIAGGK